MKRILIDLDGVLNDYCGDYIENFIPPVQKEAKNFLEALSKSFEIIIFSTRDPGLVEKWVQDNNLQNCISAVTDRKLPAFVQIDDRCIKFNGDYNETIEKIKDFKPHWAKV